MGVTVGADIGALSHIWEIGCSDYRCFQQRAAWSVCDKPILGGDLIYPLSAYGECDFWIYSGGVYLDFGYVSAGGLDKNHLCRSAGAGVGS
jgi:hypothetical protein